jgi:hypothetical protein
MCNFLLPPVFPLLQLQIFIPLSTPFSDPFIYVLPLWQETSSGLSDSNSFIYSSLDVYLTLENLV